MQYITIKEMAVIKQLDKRSGITYIYESKSVWDRERKQSRSVRRLIGRLDAKTGEIIETDGRRSGGKALGETLVPVKAAAPRPKKSGPAASASMSERKFCGATCLLDAIGGKTGVSFVKDIIAREGQSMRRWDRYSDQYGIYVHSETVKWDYEQERPYKGDVLSGDRRMYLHLYHNPEKALEDEMNFNRMILSLKAELLSGERKQGHDRLYAKYFDIKETPVRGVKITVKEDACEAAKKLYGYFVLLSNDIKDPIKALQIYRSKDVVEKAFGNIKERLGGRRMLVSSDASLEGKLFVHFIALIYLSYIRKHMIDKKLFDKYTLRGLLDELDLVECFRHPGKEPYIGEMLDKQRRIYLDMDVPVPANVTSLCVDSGMQEASEPSVRIEGECKSSSHRWTPRSGAAFPSLW